MQDISPEIMPETKNKTFAMVSAILLISIALIIAIFFNKNRSDQELTSEVLDQEQEEVALDLETQEVEEAGETLLFADLIANKAGSYICRIDNEQGSYIYYFDNERIAIEVIVPDSHSKTIIDNQFTHHWDLQEKVGTLFSNEEAPVNEEIDSTREMIEEESITDWDEENILPAEDVGPFDPANFVCRAWETDEEVFTIPSDVVFQDLSDMPKQIMDFIQ